MFPQELLSPVLLLVILISILIAIGLLSRNYIKVSPNMVAVLSGRKRKAADGRIVGYRMVRGGAALRIPLLEKVEYLSLNVFTIPLEIRRAYTVQGVPVSVEVVTVMGPPPRKCVSTMLSSWTPAAASSVTLTWSGGQPACWWTDAH